MDDDHHDGVFFTAEDQDCDENQTVLIQNSISPISDHQQPTFPGISMEEILVHEAAACYSDYMLSSEHLSTFGVVNPSSPPFQQTNPAIGSNTCSDEIKHARADSLETKRKLEIHEDGVEGEQTNWDCRRQKRRRSSEVHNLNERLRRQKLQEKMKALRELIPNCDKREKGHVLDEAMKYIKTLQSQVQFEEEQMMSMGAGVSMFHSPFTMPQHGMQIPTFPLLPPTNEYGIGIRAMGMGMGIPSLPSTMNAPMSHSGLPSPFSFASAVSGLCAPSSSSSPSAHSIQYYPGNYVLPPWNRISFPNSVSQCTTSTEQGAPINGNDFCPIPVIGEGCSTGRGSSARVLPSQIIRPRVVREIKDYGCSISGSSEWDTSSSVAKSEDCS